VQSYETLLDRARREAILRCKEQARARGFQAVVNLRLETTRISRASNNSRATAGVEVLAFGTGLELRRDPSRAGLWKYDPRLPAGRHQHERETRCASSRCSWWPGAACSPDRGRRGR
jgi:hypothetical protein